LTPEAATRHGRTVTAFDRAGAAAPRCDLVVVGAGIVGLAHAVEAVRRGLSVTVVERDERAVGASVRNFGHVCVTAQAGRALRLATAARRRWIELGAAAGFWVGETGTVVAARADDEMAVLAELAAERDDDVRLLDAAALRALAPVSGEGLLGGAHLGLDLRVDPRQAVPALARWVATQPGVRMLWSTSLLAVEPGVVRTSRGPIEAAQAVVCVGHDVDRLFPAVATEADLRRCALHMLQVAAPGGRRYSPAVLTGTSLLRYAAFGKCPSAVDVRRRLECEAPELLAADVNLMFTQRPDGDLTIGDTHHRDHTVDAFQDEALDDLLLAETARLLGVDRLTVRRRWQGIYATAPGEFLVATPVEAARVVSVTTGIGMTTALGLAPEVLDDLGGPAT
jgi:FAD dependent oxidoreductase TIGR03364